MAEEEGMEIYETNDADGIYFPERYILRTDWDTELSQVLKIASEELKQNITTKDEQEEAIEDLDDWAVSGCSLPKTLSLTSSASL